MGEVFRPGPVNRGERKKKHHCSTAPAAPTGVSLHFHKRMEHHQKVWTARVHFNAVTADVNGKPITPERYEIQLAAVDASGDQVETLGEIGNVHFPGSEFTVQGGTAPIGAAPLFSRARELNGSGDVVKHTLTQLTAGIAAQVDFYARKDAGGSTVQIRCYIWDVTAGSMVGVGKVLSPTRLKFTEVVATRNFTPAAAHTYEARAEYVSGTGVAYFDGTTHHDSQAAAVWKATIPADDDSLGAHFPIVRAHSWFYTGRVRCLNRIHGGRCWSAWSGWTTPAMAADDDAELGPPDVTGLTMAFKRDSPANHPWRARITWNEVPRYLTPDGEMRLGAKTYDLVLEASASDGGTVLHRRRAKVPAHDDEATGEHSFQNLRGRRWYRVKIRPRDGFGNVGAWSGWAGWGRPYAAPAPPQNVTWSNPTRRRFLVKWDPPNDRTDVDGYIVRIIRQGGGGTLVDEHRVAKSTHSFSWHISDAEFAAYPTATYRARVLSFSDPISTEPDDTPGVSFDSEVTSASYVESTDASDTALWTADDIDTDTLPPAEVGQIGGGNLIINSSMEIKTNDGSSLPDHVGTYSWSGSPTWGSYGRSAAYVFDQSYSCYFSWTNGTNRQGARIDLPPFPNMYWEPGWYVFSAWMRTNAAPDGLFGAGDFNISDFTWIENPTPNLNAWQRYIAKFNVPTGSNGGLYIACTASSGAFYLDAIQLERGEVPTAYAPRVSSRDMWPPAYSPAATATVPNIAKTVIITWSAVPNADPVTYEVWRHTSSPFTPPGTGTMVGAVSVGTSFTDTSGVAGTPYYYRIIATDGDLPNPAAGTVSAAATPRLHASDNSVPSSSPSVASGVKGGVGYISAEWDAITNYDPVTYEVHMSSASGFTPDRTNWTTLSSEVDGTICFIKQQTGADGGGALVYGRTYYVKIVAKDVDGAAAAGTQGSAKMVQVNHEDIAANSIYANNIESQKITASWLNSALVLSGAIYVPNQTGQRVTLSPQGLKLYDSNNVPQVILPTESGATASFNGDVTVGELSTLAAQGEASFEGTVSLENTSDVVLQAGVTKPTQAPGMSQGIDMVSLGYTLSEGQVPGGAWHDGTNLYYHVGPQHWFDTDDHTMFKLSANGSTLVSTQVLTMPAGTWGGYWVMPSCPVKYSTYWYGMAYNPNDGWSWLRWSADGSGGLPGTVDNAWPNAQDNGNVDCVLTLSGSTIYTAQNTNANACAFRSYTPAGPPTYGSLVTSSDTPYSKPVFNFYVGNGDYGSFRYIIRGVDLGYVRVYNSSGTLSTTEHWNAAETDSSTRSGLWYYNGNFYEGATDSLDAYKYSTFKAHDYVSGYEMKVFGRYSWYDNSGTVHETALSPSRSLTWQNRRKLIFTWPMIPRGAGGADDPSSVRIWMIQASSDPGEDFSSWKYQTIIDYPYTSTILNTYSTSTDTKDADFPSTGGASITPSPGAGVYVSPLQSSGDGFMPVGAIIAWGGSTGATIPTGWLYCDGGTFQSTTYPDLATVLGDRYGTHSGTTYYKPDFRDKGIAGLGTYATLGGTPGGQMHNNQGGHAHDAHGVAIPDHTRVANSQGTQTGYVVTSAGHSGSHASAGDHQHENHNYQTGAVPPYTGVNFLIKAN